MNYGIHGETFNLKIYNLNTVSVCHIFKHIVTKATIVEEYGWKDHQWPKQARKCLTKLLSGMEPCYVTTFTWYFGSAVCVSFEDFWECGFQSVICSKNYVHIFTDNLKSNLCTRGEALAPGSVADVSSANYSFNNRLSLLNCNEGMISDFSSTTWAWYWCSWWKYRYHYCSR